MLLFFKYHAYSKVEVWKRDVRLREDPVKSTLQLQPGIEIA